jgi:hypothetical protein
VDANDIDIRSTPDGPATGNMLNQGDAFIANDINDMTTPDGQIWIDGWYSANPKWIGWIRVSYLKESDPSSCVRIEEATIPRI